MSGVVTSTITPDIKLAFTYVAVDENLSGKHDITNTLLGVGAAGSNVPQSRGDNFALIIVNRPGFPGELVT